MNAIVDAIKKSSPIEYYQEALAGLKEVDQTRQAAFESFLAQGWPHRRMENWRYTSLQRLAQAQYPLFQKKQKLSAPKDLPIFPNAIRIVVSAGQWQCLDTLPKGLTIADNHSAAVIKGIHPLAALNGALYQSGTLLTVAADCRIELPIYILNLMPTDCANTALHIRNRIVVEKNAYAEIIEHHSSEADIAYHHNIVNEVFLAENAQLIYHKIQAESLLAHHTVLVNVQQSAHSKFYYTSFSLGSQLAREDIQSSLAEKAICQMRGAYIPCGTQHTDYHLDVTHAASFSESEMHFKGVLSDQATAVFNGKVLVVPGIQKISAVQKNNNILLSQGCEVNSKPELEIYSDDIRCTHGATIGHIDPAALFYLRARGLSVSEAKLLIITAFVQTEIDAIQNSDVRAFIENIAMRRLSEACHVI